MSTRPVIVRSYRMYRFEGWLFSDWHLWPLKKNGELRAKAGRQFFQMWTRFDALPKAEKEKLRVGGGCRMIRMKGVVANAK
jgi:hypothetical protein